MPESTPAVMMSTADRGQRTDNCCTGEDLWVGTCHSISGLGSSHTENFAPAASNHQDAYSLPVNATSCSSDLLLDPSQRTGWERYLRTRRKGGDRDNGGRKGVSGKEDKRMRWSGVAILYEAFVPRRNWLKLRRTSNTDYYVSFLVRERCQNWLMPSKTPATKLPPQATRPDKSVARHWTARHRHCQRAAVLCSRS